MAQQAPPVPPAAVPVADLTERVNAQSKLIQTMNATVKLSPTAGSVYTGVISEYHDVRAFILVDQGRIRTVVQAPVVRTTVLDMASDGKQFRVSIPSKGKFIVGSTAASEAAKNPLENLRPQHLLDALRIPPLQAEGHKYFVDQERDDDRVYDALNVVAEDEAGHLHLTRRVWFDATSLDLARAAFYDSAGVEVEVVRYDDYRDFGGIRYPAEIDLSRPVDGYRMLITFEKVTFNQPIAPDKFDLKQPPGSELLELGANPKALRGGPG